VTHEQRIMAAIRGEALDQLPFVPRLDLWYKGNLAQGTLPDKYKHASLVDIVDDLGLGYHCVIPDFSTFEEPYDPADVGLGIHRTKSVFYTVEFDLERKVELNGPETVTTYRTPYGDITTKVYYDDEMKRAGITQAHITKPAVETEEDYQKIGYIFEHGAVKPRYHYYDAIKAEIGDRGPVVGFFYEGGSPMHALLKEMVPFETFWFHTYDYPELMEECCAKIETLMDKMLACMADSPADLLYVGANYDSMTTNPPFFAQHITPYLKKASAFLHGKGKYLLTHTDGDNAGLLEEYVKADIDVADSVCTAPMIGQTIKDTRDVLGSHAVWGGICSISVLEDSFSQYEFEKYIDETLSSIGDGRSLVLSVADSTPPGAKFDRILHIMKKVREFGPVK
jgi:uroporphyrinogen-III decarboxylase